MKKLTALVLISALLISSAVPAMAHSPMDTNDAFSSTSDFLHNDKLSTDSDSGSVNAVEDGLDISMVDQSRLEEEFDLEMVKSNDSTESFLTGLHFKGDDLLVENDYSRLNLTTVYKYSYSSEEYNAENRRILDACLIGSVILFVAIMYWVTEGSY